MVASIKLVICLLYIYNIIYLLCFSSFTHVSFGTVYTTIYLSLLLATHYKLTKHYRSITTKASRRKEEITVI